MPRFGLRVLVVTVALLGSAAAVPSPASAVTPRDLGTLGAVTVGDTGAACPTGHSCFKTTVTCPGISQSRTGHFAVSPVPTGESRGVVVIFSGGSGAKYWTKDTDDGSVGEVSTAKTNMLTDLYQKYGLRVVQVRWGGSWYSAPSGVQLGPAAMACRPSTLLDYIRNTYYETIAPVPTPDPGECGFCVTGTSGGSAQATYPLSHYGFGTDPSRLTHAVLPFSGPTHAAIDKRCLLVPGYADDKFADFDTPYGYLNGGGPCATHDPAFAPHWNDDKVDSATTAESSLPNTRVHVIVGETDKDIQSHAADYRTFISGLTETTEIVPAMGHAPSVAGITSLKNALISGLTVVVSPTPTITSFTPSSGPVGTSVAVTGTGFGGATTVKFNGLAATTFSVISQTQLTATVPAGSTNGSISVTTPGGTATSATSFTVIAGPTISSFTPASGPTGTQVTVNGSELSGTTGVTFNGAAAIYQVLSGSQLRATVPASATTGPIAVTTPSGTAISGSSFTVTTGGGTLSLTAMDASAMETDPGQTAKKCLVKVKLSATPSTQVTVMYSTTPNTATSPSDYAHQAGKVLTWAAGATGSALTKNAPVTLTADTIAELPAEETFYVNLSSPTGGATIGDAQAVCTVTDDVGG